MAEKFLQL